MRTRTTDQTTPASGWPELPADRLAEYQRGYRAGFAYWTDHPEMVQTPERKRRWLANQLGDFRNGWSAGSSDAA